MQPISAARIEAFFSLWYPNTEIDLIWFKGFRPHGEEIA
jgi:hypothetical protein